MSARANSRDYLMDEEVVGEESEEDIFGETEVVELVKQENHLDAQTDHAFLLMLAKLGKYQTPDMQKHWKHACECDFVMSFLVAMAGHVSTLVVSVVLVWFFKMSTVEHIGDPFEDSQRVPLIQTLQYHIDSGVSIGANKTKVGMDSLKICVAFNTRTGSHAIILLLWFMTMTQEIFHRFHSIHCYCNVATEDDGDEPEAMNEVRSMSLFSKITILLTISIPRLIITVMIMMVGAEFLAYTHDMGSLILKAFGITYVLTVDKRMFGSFASEKYSKWVAASTVVYYQTHHMDFFGVRIHLASFNLWATAIGKLTAAVLLLVYFRLTHTEIQELEDACVKYWEAFGKPCIGGGKTCGETSIADFVDFFH